MDKQTLKRLYRHSGLEPESRENAKDCGRARNDEKNSLCPLPKT